MHRIGAAALGLVPGGAIAWLIFSLLVGCPPSRPGSEPMSKNDHQERRRATPAKKPAWGFIDRTGKVIIPCRYEHAGSFYQGSAVVTVGGKDGCINKAGEFIIPPRYEELGSVVEGLAHVRVGRKHGYLDEKGRMVIAPMFDFADYFYDGLSRIQVGGHYG